jgi:hypothetical protein
VSFANEPRLWYYVGLTMLIVILVFLAVFFCRDVQVLAMQSPRHFAPRFAIYCVLQLAAMALLVQAWTLTRDDSGRTLFAWVAIGVQLAELAAAIILSRLAAGRFSWLGWLLPPPALSAALFGVTLIVRTRLIAAEPASVALPVLGLWLCLVGGPAFLLNRIDKMSHDRKFVTDFALLTSCTALVFVPFGLP